MCVSTIQDASVPYVNWSAVHELGLVRLLVCHHVETQNQGQFLHQVVLLISQQRRFDEDATLMQQWC